MRIGLALLAASALALSSCSDQAFLALYLPREGDGVEIDRVSSSVSGLDYALYVGLPDSYGSGDRADPLAIMTDGDWDFASAFESARDLMRRGECEEFILAGLGYGYGEDRRGQDLTPTRDPEWERLEYGEEDGPSSGGADDFLAFIADDLLPLLEARYRVEAGRGSRCLAGHSLGGLFALYASVRRPELFGSIVASSPSLYWDSRVAFGLLDAYLLEPSPDPTFVFGSIGAQEGFPNDLFLEAWLDRVEDLPGHGTEERYFPDTVHACVQTLAIPAGLCAAFGRELAR